MKPGTVKEADKLRIVVDRFYDDPTPVKRRGPGIITGIISPDYRWQLVGNRRFLGTNQFARVEIASGTSDLRVVHTSNRQTLVGIIGQLNLNLFGDLAENIYQHDMTSLRQTLEKLIITQQTYEPRS